MLYKKKKLLVLAYMPARNIFASPNIDYSVFLKDVAKSTLFYSFDMFRGNLVC